MPEGKVMNRWLVVVGGILIQLCLGAIYAWSVFTPSLKAAGWTSQQTQYVFSAGLASFAIVMVAAGAFLMPRLGPRKLAILGGIVLRCAAIVTLGRSFTPNIEVSEDQKIVTSGLYRYMRHPAYTGLLMILLGWGFTFESWVAVAGVFGFPLAAFVHRMGIEEAALQKAFGDTYTEYKSKTKALIPFIV